MDILKEAPVEMTAEDRIEGVRKILDAVILREGGFLTKKGMVNEKTDKRNESGDIRSGVADKKRSFPQIPGSAIRYAEVQDAMVVESDRGVPTAGEGFRDEAEQGDEEIPRSDRRGSGDAGEGQKGSQDRNEDNTELEG